MDREAYPLGSVVLVPFPFTDLSGRKRRPALIVSPEGFHEEDIVLCAITSQIPPELSEWEASLEAEDMVEEKLPKQSIVKAGKLFTMHQELIAGQFGAVKEHKLQEVLGKLRALFEYTASRPAGSTAAGDEPPEDELTVRTE